MQGLPLTSPKFNALGNAADTRAAVAAVEEAHNGPMLVVGLSAGSAALVRYLGEAGAATPAVGAVLVSPGYQIPAAW